MRGIQFGFVLTALMNLCGCVGVYLHDEGLAARTSTAKEQIMAVSLDAPFTDELEYLEKLAEERERSLIRFGVAERDRQIAIILEDQRNVAQTLDKQADLMLALLLCGGPNYYCIKQGSDDFYSVDNAFLFREKNELLQALVAHPSEDGFNKRIRQSTEQAIARNSNLLREFGGKPPSCRKLFEREKEDQVATWRRLARVPVDLSWPQTAAQEHLEAKIYVECDRLRNYEREGAAIGLTFNTYDSTGNLLRMRLSDFVVAGQLRAAIDEHDDAVARVNYKAKAEGNEAIEGLIKEAEGIVKSGVKSDLDDFKSKAFDTLDGLSGVAKEAGWEHLESELDRVIKSQICGSDSSASDEAKVEANCDAVEVGDPTDKADAIWMVLNELASLQDTRALDGRNANWMIAAKAIANANVEDSKIVAQRDRKVADHQSNRMRALAIQASAAACIKLALRDGGCNGRVGRHHALSSYADAWNEGSIPASVYAERADREFRIAWVLRSKSVSDRQISLITAAINQLDHYGQLGLKDELIARIINTTALVDIAGDR